MAEKKTTPLLEPMTWEEHISHAMRLWKEDYPKCKGFSDFPLEGIRISADVINREYFEMGAAKWLNFYYRNNLPVLNDVDKAYKKVTKWLVDMTPSRVLTMNTREAFEVLCCKIWTLIITEEYGIF